MTMHASTRPSSTPIPHSMPNTLRTMAAVVTATPVMAKVNSKSCMKKNSTTTHLPMRT